jgi:hypothetical protein
MHNRYQLSFLHQDANRPVPTRELAKMTVRSQTDEEKSFGGRGSLEVCCVYADALATLLNGANCRTALELRVDKKLAMH